MTIKHCTPGSLTLAAVLLLFGGCATSHPKAKVAEAPKPVPAVQAADKLFQAGQYEQAIAACIVIAQKDPLTPGLSDLEARIQEKMAVLRAANVERKTGPSDANAIADGLRHGLLPDTYGLHHTVRGDTSSLRTPPTKMQQVLRQPVSIHLENVGLSDIVAQIGASQNINIITDGSIGAGTLTIHAQNTPLSEILDYIGRNLNVAFSVGENVIWVTKRMDTNGSGEPYETRIYHLRKGLSGEEIQSSGGGGSGGSASKGGGGGAGESSGSAPSAATLVPSLIDAVKRFVPQPTGADILFSEKAHALLVKNTRENLVLVEDLISALDVRPVQVLIEARFMDVTVSDLRELGVDWILHGSIGIPNHDSSTQLKNVGINTISLGTASDMAQNPSYGTAGLGLTYQGVLGGAQFQALLHALQQSGKARTLTVPRLTTLNNRTAKIRIGRDFRYFDSFSQQTTAINELINGVVYPENLSYWVPSGSAVLAELGYELQVTPSVGADLSSIDLKLVPDISDVEDRARWVSYNQIAYNSDGSSTTNSISLPIFDRKRIDTELNVHSGETVVMGGLANTTHTTTSTGVPFLSSLPLIGHLFRTDTTQDNVDNLIIFVTATILADTGEQLVPLNASEPVGLPTQASVK